MVVPHPKGGGIVWTCVEDNVVGEKEEYKAIELRGFYYKLFQEEEGEGVREGIDGYPYLKRLIELWPGYWVEQLSKMNEEVDERNRHHKATGKRQSVQKFSNNDFWKYIGCIISAFTYGKEGYTIWKSTTRRDGCKAACKIDREVRGKIDLLKVSCTLYCLNYSFLYH